MSCPLVYRLEWQGIGMTIQHEQNAWGIIEHIEITTDNRQALPITETGYKSHFLDKKHLADYADATAFVKAWLDHAGQSAEWQEHCRKTQQLSLF